MKSQNTNKCRSCRWSNLSGPWYDIGVHSCGHEHGCNFVPEWKFWIRPFMDEIAVLAMGAAFWTFMIGLYIWCAVKGE